MISTIGFIVGAAEPLSFNARLVEANRLLDEGKPAEALAVVKAASLLDTNRFEAPFLAAVIFLELKKPEPARLALDAALTLAPPAKKAKIEELKQEIDALSKSANQSAKSLASSPKLSPATQRQVDVMMLIIEEADRAKLDTERKTLLREFLQKSEPFLKEYPDQQAIWTLRAVAALELNEPAIGWRAGREMVKLGADNSADPKIRRVMAMLERKTWIKSPQQEAEEQAVEERRAAFARDRKAVEQAILAKAWGNSLGMKFVPVPGTSVQFCLWETRVQDFATFVQEAGRTWEKPSFSQDGSHPAVNVSWEDAQAFCQWLSKKEGKTYRLPTDPEWSAAVGLGQRESGGTPREKDSKVADVYPWGTSWPPPTGAGNYSSSLNVDSFENTSPAGSFAANENGLHDLGGNVWEWCEDSYDNDQKYRVLRGGAWRDVDPRNLLSSFRLINAPGYRYVSFGFRVVLVSGESR